MKESRFKVKVPQVAAVLPMFLSVPVLFIMFSQRQVPGRAIIMPIALLILFCAVLALSMTLGRKYDFVIEQNVIKVNKTEFLAKDIQSFRIRGRRIEIVTPKFGRRMTTISVDRSEALEVENAIRGFADRHRIAYESP